MKILKKVLIGFISLMVVILAILILWLVQQYIQGPLTLLSPLPAKIEVAQDSIFTADYLPVKRIYHALSFKIVEHTALKCLISFPDYLLTDQLPVVIILGGLEVSHFVLKYIPDPGQNIIIIYQYPYHPDYWYQGTVRL
jgi:hypothetical protein